MHLLYHNHTQGKFPVMVQGGILVSVRLRLPYLDGALFFFRQS